MVELSTGTATAIAAGGAAVVLLLLLALEARSAGPERTLTTDVSGAAVGADRARTAAGTGVGLAIVSQVAAAHGGQVLVASTEGVGSTFTLRLPAGPAASGPAPPVAPSPEP